MLAHDSDRSFQGARAGGRRLTQRYWPSGQRDRDQRSAEEQGQPEEERVAAEEGVRQC